MQTALRTCCQNWLLFFTVVCAKADCKGTEHEQHGGAKTHLKCQKHRKSTNHLHWFENVT